MNYEDAGAGLSMTASFWATSLFNPDHPVDKLGIVALETSERLRLLGLYALLGRGDSEMFLENLSRSGGAWHRFLQRAVDKKATGDHHFVSGRPDPVIDGVAAGDYELVRAMAALAPPSKQGRSEYEDDFCFVQLLFELVTDAPSGPRLKDLLDRYEAFDADSPSARLGVVRALALRDQDAFDEAFKELLDAFDAGNEDAKASGEEETPESCAAQSVCIDGLALLRIADFRGLATAPEYRFCPSLARTTLSEPFPRDFGDL